MAFTGGGEHELVSDYFTEREGLITGTYVLILRVPKRRRIQVGRLGRYYTRPGYYAYVGSAFGPGGLAARLAHHQRPVTRPHWHIDYLRSVARLHQVWIGVDDTPREHAWALCLQEMPEACCGIPRFGASDCRCRTHLFYFQEEPDVSQFSKGVGGPVHPIPYHT